MPLNWRIDTENVAHLNIRVLLSGKKKKKPDSYGNRYCEALEEASDLICLMMVLDFRLSGLL